MIKDEERYTGQHRPIAVAIHNELLAVTLQDGRVISTPLEWVPRLMDATPELCGVMA